MYVDELIGKHTVNTVPPQTLDAFRDHGKVNLTIEKDLDEARNTMIMLEECRSIHAESDPGARIGRSEGLFNCL